MDKRSQKAALESGTGQFSSKTRVDASPAKTTLPEDAPYWTYKVGTTASHDEEPHEEESAGTSQAAQPSQHHTTLGAGTSTDSRCRITFNLESLAEFLSSESGDASN